MAIYDIKAPDGRIVSIKGDTPPTDEDLDQIFANLPKKEDKPATIGDGIKSLSQTPEQIFGSKKLREYAEQPKETGIKLLNAAQLGGQIAFPLASGVSTTPITEFAMQKIKGSENPDALKQAVIAGGLDLALTGTGAAIGKLTKKVLPIIAQAMSGVPKESTQTAIKSLSEGKNIFGKQFEPIKEFTKAGEKAQKAVNDIVKKAGEGIEAEKQVLKNNTQKFDFTDLNKKVDDIVDKYRAVDENALSTTDLMELADIKNKILKTNNLADLNVIKTRDVAPLSKFKATQNAVKPISDIGTSAMKQVYETINNEIAGYSPKFAQVNQKYSNFRNLHDQIVNVLKGEKEVAENELGNIIKEESGVAGTQVKKIIEKAIKNPDEMPKYYPTLKSIDSLSKPENKFMDYFENTIKNTEAKKQLSSYIPKTPIRQKIADTLIHGTVAAPIIGASSGNLKLGVGGMLGSLGILGAMSPSTYKNIIQGTIGAEKAMKKPLFQGTTKQIASRIQDLLGE
jgi:hypothetical protein